MKLERDVVQMEITKSQLLELLNTLKYVIYREGMFSLVYSLEWGHPPLTLGRNWTFLHGIATYALDADLNKSVTGLDKCPFLCIGVIDDVQPRIGATL